ncbi:MAG: HDOD domain-containing protein [Desulfobulbaceae bacterium]|nr:HDOD domain-containing protein [Desulfobulbaceae bacterium]
MTDPHNVLHNLKVSGNLPSMPQVLVQLIDTCHQPDVDLQKIGKIVKKDAALSAKILQLCNSAFIGAHTAFVDVQQAVIYLGGNTIKNLAISVSVQQVFRRVETNSLLSIDRFWYHSLRNAILAQKIAEAASYPTPSEAYLGGLLHDIGKLLLWMAFPGKYAPLLLKGVRCHNGRLSFLEQKKLHINHCEAGAWLAEQWQMQSLFADAIRYHHHPVDEVEQGLPLTRIVYLADLLSHAEKVDSECNSVAERFFHFTPEQIDSLLEGLDEKIAEVAGSLGIRIPKKSHSSLEQEPESETLHKETSIGLIGRIRDITQMTGVLDNLIRAEKREQIISAIEQSLKILVNEDTCFLMLYDKKSRLLQGIASPENKLAREVNQLRFRMDRHNKSLPGQVVENKQLIHTFMSKADPAHTLLDTQILHLLGTDGMAVVPMVYQHQLIGLIIIGLLQDSHPSLLEHTSPLQLLASQAAVSLHLDQIHTMQAEQIAMERLESAHLIARKIAHEINNPLAILRNYMRILELKLKENKPIKEELSIIDAEFDRIGQITNQLSNLGSSQQITRIEQLNLNDLLSETINLYTMSLPEDRKITLEYVPEEALPLVETDANCIRQIMINLLGNAADALGKKGKITVNTDVDSDSRTMRITIKDNGPGVPESILPNLFSAGTTTKGGGHAGLGLAIIQKTVQELGGSISCTSSDKGTIFCITLPTSYT